MGSPEGIGRVKRKHIETLSRRCNFLTAEDAVGRANTWERAELGALRVAIAELRDILDARVKEEPQ